ncbi:iron ABC transporter permease [Janibacter melonis]|uniref:FecCD family ABC transporter permease n=1 Tax=Janibacter melonis TaxID=262209 RepID=UPI001E48DD39|nr:iron ABC transporter permease [Janibacter melonis]MCB5992253.1 iron ABC transporter permease [Janibacter melonis]
MSHDRPGGRRLPVVPLLLVLLVLTVVSGVVSLGLGSEPLPLRGVVDVLRARVVGAAGPDPALDTIVWELRAPRAVMAMVVGAGLAVAGACMQTLVRNPLADPYLLGVSAGAGVGATLVILLGALAGLGVWALSLGALGGALVATALVLGISLAQGGITPLRLVLTGVVMSAAFSSVSSLLVFLSADPRATQSVLFWLLGSLSGSVWQQVLPPVLVVVVSGVVLLALHRWLDALAAGPDVAGGLGVPVRELRLALFVLVSVLVGVLVAVSGGIGFVGLVVPHIARILVGARHRYVLPVAAAGGALFLLWVDVAARTVVRPQEIPLSVVTGLVGAPIFLVLLGRRHYSYSGGAG